MLGIILVLIPSHFDFMIFSVFKKIATFKRHRKTHTHTHKLIPYTSCSIFPDTFYLPVFYSYLFCALSIFAKVDCTQMSFLIHACKTIWHELGETSQLGLCTSRKKAIYQLHDVCKITFVMSAIISSVKYKINLSFFSFPKKIFLHQNCED